MFQTVVRVVISNVKLDVHEEISNDFECLDDFFSQIDLLEGWYSAAIDISSPYFTDATHFHDANYGHQYD